LRQLRADYERDLQDLRKPAVAAFEKLEAEKRQKRLDEAAARRKEILAEALGKAAARNTGGESSINSNAGANAKPKIRRGKAGDPSAPEQTAVSEPAASPQPLQAEIPKLLEGPVGSSSPSTAGTTETPP
jgi:hypothetical protein